MKKMVFKILIVFVCAVYTVILTGCLGHAAEKVALGTNEKVIRPVMDSHGSGKTEEEHTADHARQLNLNGSMFIDDLDAILQWDRPSRLTEYTIR